MTPAEEFAANQRLNNFFSSFNKNEPFAVTKNRVDLTKGFVDNSPEGNSINGLMNIQQADDPRQLFGLFDDGFHTPATKQPKHESFLLNSPKRQAIAMALFPDQKRPAPTNISVVEQLLNRVGGRVR